MPRTVSGDDNRQHARLFELTLFQGTEPRSAEGVECRKCGESKFSSAYQHKTSSLTLIQLATFLVTVPKAVEVTVAATTAARRATSRATARSPAIWPRCSAATAMNLAICPRNAPSHAIVGSSSPLVSDIMTSLLTRLVDRVQCSNCQQMGHFKSACTAPTNTGTGGGAFGNDGDNGGDFYSTANTRCGRGGW